MMDMCYSISDSNLVVEFCILKHTDERYDLEAYTPIPMTHVVLKRRFRRQAWVDGGIP